jgi:aminoglycoside phosphotransferase (APT) family kinase protein
VSSQGSEVTLARAGALQAWVRTWTQPSATVTDIRRLTGHSGETLSFDVTTRDGRSGYVARLAPTGVKRSGNTDILRQVPLLQRLHVAELPVAQVVAWSREDERLGTDVVVQQRVAGYPLHMFDPSLSVSSSAEVEPYLHQAVETLARIHAADVDGWEDPRTISDEVGTWTRLLPRLPEPDWAKRAGALAEELLRNDPGEHAVGLIHGDYQTNNILYATDGRLLAVIDWELACVGATGLDVGWLAMMLDPACWGPSLRDRLLVRGDPSQIRAWYEAAAGAPLPQFDWYLALSCFRYGVIGAYNVRLHRIGRRVDEFNAAMADTVPLLLDHGLRILTG